MTHSTPSPAHPLEGPRELPPLPEPRAIRAGHSFPKVYALAYTADQMQEYARTALAASGLSPALPEPDHPKPSAPAAAAGVDERAMFEAWCCKRWAGDREALHQKYEDDRYTGEYVNGHVQFAWSAWQARASTPAAAAWEAQAEPMRIWVDCEFNEHAGRHELISMALVADDGREWYEVLPCAWPGSWVAENVMPKLGKVPISHEAFAESLREFLAPYKVVHVIADWPSDIALFCDALIVSAGCRIDTPLLTLEVIRLDGESADPHNALADARGIRDVHRSALASAPPKDPT